MQMHSKQCYTALLRSHLSNHRSSWRCAAGEAMLRLGAACGRWQARLLYVQARAVRCMELYEINLLARYSSEPAA